LGYNIHRMLNLLAPCRTGLLCKGARVGGLIADKLFGKLGMDFEEWHRAGQLLTQLPDFCQAYGILRNVWDSPQMRRQLYGPRMLDACPDNAFDFLRCNWPEDSDPVIAVANFELENKMINDLLLNEDRLSMAFGLEVRVPFLDEDLVARASSLTSQQRMPKGRLKYLMRRVVADYLPAEILNRPKSGFQVPIHQFFNTHLRPICDQYLNKKRVTEDGLFNYKFISEVLAAKPHKRLRWHYFLLYLMLGTAIWIDIFEKDQEVPPWN
ncbi:MAG: asparagine synthase C-terminal domain-containing protein, partial [Desulfobulbaceae bacterium]|nr:asparagine synthase C-terminal domain-containing protein [Desulfobulbaceae bacterium]